LAKPATAAGRVRAAVEDGSLFDRLTALPNLWECWRKAKKSKSNNIRIQRFAEDPLRYVLTIQQRLRAGTYTFGPYNSFEVQEKKRRHVIDAPIKDRVVHWMIYRHLLTIWQPRFIADAFGNLPGRGTHAAVKRLGDFCRAGDATYALQLDISKYFYSINHDELKARALRYIGDHKLRQLIERLIDSFVTDGRFDELFAPGTAYRQTLRKGIPIGNLPSIPFANIYLNDFDHWIKEVLRVKSYLRYMDDIVIVGQDKDELRQIGAAIAERLAGLGLTIHPHKTRLAPISTGVPFLGYIVWPNHISVGAHTRRRYHRALRQQAEGRDVDAALNSYHAALSHTGSTIYRGTK